MKTLPTLLDHLRERLAACPLSREQLAALTNGALSASWISKFACGHMDNPRINSLIALEAALDQCAELETSFRKCTGELTPALAAFLR